MRRTRAFEGTGVRGYERTPECPNARTLELANACSPIAGRKRLAVLRAAVCTVDERGHAVLCALCGPDAGARLADGDLQIPAPLCDALIELLACLPVALTAQGTGHSAEGETDG